VVDVEVVVKEARISTSIINDNEETFACGFYNRVQVMRRDFDGYINATLFCKQFGKIFNELEEEDS
jgi:hypothetical protein